MKLKWHSPLHPNGLIRGYRIFIHDVAGNQTEYRETANSQTEIEYEITKLRPFTRYRVWLKAFTAKHMGNSSEPLLIRTDVQAPPAPRITNLSCSMPDALYIQWIQPAIAGRSYERINQYIVQYRADGEPDFRGITVQTNQDYGRSETELFITNLTENVLYEVKVKAAVKSIVENFFYYSDFSDARKVVLQSKCTSK